MSDCKRLSGIFYQYGEKIQLERINIDVQSKNDSQQWNHWSSMENQYFDSLLEFLNFLSLNKINTLSLNYILDKPKNTYMVNHVIMPGISPEDKRVIEMGQSIIKAAKKLGIDPIDFAQQIVDLKNSKK